MSNRSKEELDFIEESKRKARIQTDPFESTDASDKTVEEYGRIPWWRRYLTWSFFFFALAFLSSGTLIALFMALEKVYSVPTIKYILESGGLAYAKETKDYFLLSIYDYRWAIILGIFAFFVAMAILMLILELQRIKKIDEKNSVDSSDTDTNEDIAPVDDNEVNEDIPSSVPSVEEDRADMVEEEDDLPDEEIIIVDDVDIDKIIEQNIDKDSQ